jgi:hypothetical protein
MVLDQVGLPIEGIAIILGVDRLMDMIRTAVNITGDAVVSTIVAKSEGQLDMAFTTIRTPACWPKARSPSTRRPSSGSPARSGRTRRNRRSREGRTTSGLCRLDRDRTPPDRWV